MSNEQIVFRGGIQTVLGFAAAFAVVTAIWVPLTAAVSDHSVWVKLLIEISKFAVIAGFVWILLRIDDVRLAELGLSRRHLVSALMVFSALWVGLNLLGIGLAELTDNQWAVSLIWYLPESAPTVRKYAPLPATWLTLLLLNFLVIGLVEEIAFRGYFQSKMIALLGDDSRLHITLGIILTSIVFGALHTPAAVVSGQSLGGILGSATLPAVTAVLFGIFYELTHNVYFVALLHGLGNSWPLVVNWANWSGNALVAFWVGAACLYLVATLAYRYWIIETGQPLSIDRVETGDSLVN